MSRNTIAPKQISAAVSLPSAVYKIFILSSFRNMPLSDRRTADVLQREERIHCDSAHTRLNFCKLRLGFGQPLLLRRRQPVFLLQLTKNRDDEGEAASRVIAILRKFPV